MPRANRGGQVSFRRNCDRDQPRFISKMNSGYREHPTEARWREKAFFFSAGKFPNTLDEGRLLFIEYRSTIIIIVLLRYRCGVVFFFFNLIQHRSLALATQIAYTHNVSVIANYQQFETADNILDVILFPLCSKFFPALQSTERPREFPNYHRSRI